MDLIIRQARIMDGSGAVSSVGDVAVSGDRIVAIGDLDRMVATQEVHSGGKALAPGFIDTHTHDDRALLSDPLMACKVSQGITTVITGNCGLSLAPLCHEGPVPPALEVFGIEGSAFVPTFEDYLARLDDMPPAVNAACQVGHATLRVGTVAAWDRPATRTELAAMRRGPGAARRGHRAQHLPQ